MSRVYQIVILILFGIILYLQMCRPSRPCPDGKIIKRDTVWFKDSSVSWQKAPKPDTQWLPAKPYPVVVTLEDERIPYLSNLVEELRNKKIDSQAIVQRYLSIHTDYFKVRTYHDSTKTGYAAAHVWDTVSQNRLIARGLKLYQNTPVVTNTVSSQRLQLYLGVSIIGTENTLVDAVEGSLTLKTKKDQMFELGVSKPWTRDLQFRLGTKFKLSLKRQ